MSDRQQLKQAFKEGLIDEIKFKNELFKLATQIKEKKSRRHYESVSEEEFKKIINLVSSKKIKLAMHLAYGSGLRLEEILNLKQDEVKETKIFVRQGKGNKDRTVNRPKYLKEEYIKLLPLNITRMGIQKAFLKASIKSGINRELFRIKLKNGKERIKWRLHFHCLRHSYATQLLEKGVPINKVQILLGHSNVSTTSEYIKANPNDAIDAAIKAGM